MSADQDIGLDEKRVYEGDERETTVYVASGTGVVAVSVVADRIGGFELVARCTARDVAAGPVGVAVGTDEGVLLDANDGDFRDVGFGPATAVAINGETVVAAAPDGTVARVDPGASGEDAGSSDSGGSHEHEGGTGEDGWRELGTLTAVNGMDGDLVASDDGVYRVLEDGLRHAGLTSAADVAASGVPLAATDEALYQLGNGWMDVATGAFRFVTTDPGADPGTLGRAHAGTDDHLYAHHDGAWTVETALEEAVVDVAYGDTVYAVSGDGRLVAEGPEAWRHQELGVRDVAAATARTAPKE